MKSALTSAEIIRAIDDGEVQLKFNYCLADQINYSITLVDSDQQVGYCDLRFGHSAELYYYGNIGYRVNEPYRGHGYASKASRLMLKLARIYGFDYVLITCSPDNIASKKTIESLNAVYLKTVNVPIWHPLYRTERIKMIYRIDF